MKDTFPGEKTSQSPEVLYFLPEDTSLSVNAVAYNVSYSLSGLESNYPVDGYFSMDASLDESTDIMNKIVQYVQNGEKLISKLIAHHEDTSQPLELTDDELTLMGLSLYRYGIWAYNYANKAIDEETVVFDNEQHRQEISEKIAQRRDRSFTLYKYLEPRAKEKNITWMVWEQPEVPFVKY